MNIRVLTSIGVFLLSSFTAFGVNVNFYGHLVPVTTSSLESIRAPYSINKSTIDYSVRRLERLDNSQLLAELKVVGDYYNLDDLGTVMLVRKVVQGISTNRKTQNLLQYHLLNQLGYDVRLTYTASSISCFGRLEHKPASSVYILLNGRRYTNLDFTDMSVKGRRYLYKANARKDRTIKFSGKPPTINARKKQRSFRWIFQGRMFELNAVNNLSYTAYLNDLPQFNLGNEYVKMEASDEFRSSVIEPLREYVSEMSSNEQKANFLLNFVQSTSGYKTDDEQYGREKYNYPEETMANPYSDCEDKTLLLAFLYKELLDFESVILHFKRDKHVCLGVKLPNRSNSYSFTYNDEAYMVCEPTGRGYKVGRTAIALGRVSEVIELF
jgi:hypothetical protein